MAAQSATPPILQSAVPTAKEKKYDRQLRLWAASGQQALEDAKILLLNQSPGVVGVETLKNLVLPGVGSFTIVDGAKVSEPDLGLNFFLAEESLGKSRASETCAYLKELNSEVDFHSVEKHITDFVQDPRTQLSNYTLILLIGPSKDAEKISRIAEEHSIPLFYVHSVGFYSHFSVQLPKLFPVVDTHPDPASTQDLRLLNPWPELSSFQQRTTGDLAKLDDHTHGHIPYVLLLLHYLDEWKRTHDGKPPTTYAEKKELKGLVDSGARTSNPEGGEENFTEASAALLKSLNPPSISPGLREIFQETTYATVTPTTPTFWWIANGIRDFHAAHHGLLPLPGTLPDMKAQSADYVALQTLYKQKALADIAEVTANITAGAQKYLFSSPPSIPPSEIADFCKNAAHVKLIRGRPLPFNATAWTTTPNQSLSSSLSDPDSLLPLYIAFQAYDFLSSTTSTEGSLKTLTTHALSLLTPLLKSSAASDETTTTATARTEAVCAELHRAKGAELHNTAALTGGMVAQEVIKVVTRQYVPIDNACVFDGVGSRCGVFRI